MAASLTALALAVDVKGIVNMPDTGLAAQPYEVQCNLCSAAGTYDFVKATEAPELGLDIWKCMQGMQPQGGYIPLAFTKSHRCLLKNISCIEPRGAVLPAPCLTS